MSRLQLSAATLRAGPATLVDAADLTLQPGELVALVGPNGAGKTSLIRLMLGLATPSSGTAFINDASAATMPPPVRARQIAYLPQARPLAWPQTVTDVVALGRFAHGARLGRLGPADAAAVHAAMAAADITHLAARRADTLSGGEAARMHLARALAAQTPLLIADEPVAALDPLHQQLAMAILRRFVDAGGGALVVLHDLDLAARHADRLVWMKQGRILADGPVADTLTPARITQVHGVRARIQTEGGLHVLIDGPA